MNQNPIADLTGPQNQFLNNTRDLIAYLFGKLNITLYSLPLLFGCILVCLNQKVNAQSFSWASKATSSQEDFTRDLTVDNMGNYYTIGKFSGTITFDSAGFPRTLTSAGQADIYIAKFNCLRNLIWANRIGSSSNDAGDFNALAIKYDNKGNLYITGAFAGTATFTTQSGLLQTLTSAGDYDIFIAKYDTLGVVKWTVKAGGVDADEGTNLTIDYSGNIITSGFFTSTATWGTTSGSTISAVSGGTADIFIAKYNPLGRVIWVSPASSPGQDIANDVNVDKQNNIYSAGNFSCCGTGTTTFGSKSISNVSGWGAFVAKMDSNGVWSWVNGMGGPAWEATAGCIVDDSGNVFFSGHADGPGTFTSSLPGSPLPFTNNGDYDIFIGKYDTSGVLGWVKSIGSSGFDTNRDICFNQRGNIVITGGFEGTVNFSGKNLTSSGGSDVFISEYTKTGNLVQCIKAGGAAGNDDGFGIVCDAKGGMYIAGSFTSIANFGSTSLTGIGSAESFVAKISLGLSFKLAQYPLPPVCSSDSVFLFSALPLPSNSIFKWLKNGSIIPGETNDTLIAKTAGSYQLIAVNNCNEPDTSQVLVVTFSTSPSSITPVSDKMVCLGDSIQLVSGGGTSYSWSPVTGLSNPNIGNPYAKPTTNQQYIVTIFNGSCSTKDTVLVTVNQNCCFSCTSTVTINNGLVACFPFNGNSNDESGNGNNGTAQPNATLTTDRKGQPAKAYAFNGSSTARINVPASASLNTAVMTGFSYTCWFNASSSTPLIRRIINIQDASFVNYDISYNYSTNKLNFINFNGVADHINFNSKATFTINTWYHVAVVIDAANKPYLYINGVLDTFSNTTVLKPVNPVYTIGNHAVNSWNFAGKIDDVRVYNRALTSTEMMQIFLQINPPTVTPIADKTVCFGDSTQLTATGGTSYSWSPSTGLSNPNIANPYAKPTANQQYIVSISNGGCTQNDTVMVYVNNNCCATCTSAISLNNGLVACYPFTGNTSDATANGHHGTATGGVSLVSDRFGNTNNAYSLNGSSGAITIPYHNDFNFLPTGQFSISLWAKPGSTNQISGLFVKSPFHASVFLSMWDYGLYQAVNKAMGGYANNSPVVGTTAMLANSLWYHLVVTYNNGRWECYVNGILESTDYSQTKFISQSTAGISIGKKGEANGDYYNGTVDDIRIYNRVLSTLEVNELFTLKEYRIPTLTQKTICPGDSAQLSASGGTTYLWTPSTGLSNPNISNPYAKPTDSTRYQVTVSNGICSAIDSVNVNVNKITVDAGPPQTICNRDSIRLYATASAGATFTWAPAVSLSNANIDSPYAKPADTTLYRVTATLNGCSAKDSTTINVRKILADAGSNSSICIGDSVQLLATGGTIYAWKKDITLSDTSVNNPYAKPFVTTNYFVNVSDGTCTNLDSITVNIASAIFVNAGVDTSLCLGDSIRLLASGATSYAWWNAPTLSDTTVANPYVKPSDTTTYYITGKSATCFGTDSVKVNVKKTFADAGINQTICKGDSIQLNATGTPGSTFSWTPTTSLSNPTIGNPYAKPSDTTMYTVIGVSNNCSATDSVKINIRKVNPDAGAAGSVCKGDSIQLNAAGGASYTWKNDPSLSTLAGAHPYAKPTVATTYYVTVNDGTCNDIDSVNITLKNIFTLNAGIDTAMCEFDTVELHASGATSFTWIPAAGLSSTTGSNPKAFSTITTDYIVTGLAGMCYETDTVRVTIYPLPTVNLEDDTIICPNEQFTFLPAVNNADKYSWQPSTLLDDATILNPTTVIENGTQLFILTATNSITGCVNTNQILVTTHKPTARFTLEDTISAVPPLVVTPDNTSYPLPLGYQWEMLDSIPAYYTSAEPTHSFTTPGQFRILLTVTDSRGCIDTMSLMIMVSNEVTIFIPNVFTPNGDGLNDVFEVNFVPGTILGMKGSIWNRWGSMVYEFGSPDYLWWNGKVDGTDASDGVYYYIIEVIDSQNKPQKFNGTVTLLR